MPNDLTCTTCERDGLNVSTMKVHEKSKNHLDLVSEAITLPEDLLGEEIRKILEEKLAEPVECAKALRKVFSVNRWPSRKQPKSVRTVLEEAGIPIFDANSRTMTDGQVRKQRQEQLVLYQETF